METFRIQRGYLWRPLLRQWQSRVLSSPRASQSRPAPDPHPRLQIGGQISAEDAVFPAVPGDCKEYKSVPRTMGCGPNGKVLPQCRIRCTRPRTSGHAWCSRRVKSSWPRAIHLGYCRGRHLEGAGYGLLPPAPTVPCVDKSLPGPRQCHVFGRVIQLQFRSELIGSRCRLNGQRAKRLASAWLISTDCPGSSELWIRHGGLPGGPFGGNQGWFFVR